MGADWEVVHPQGRNPHASSRLTFQGPETKSWAELKVTDQRWQSPICGFLRFSALSFFLCPPNAWFSRRRCELVNFTLAGLRFHALQTWALSPLALSHACTPSSYRRRLEGRNTSFRRVRPPSRAPYITATGKSKHCPEKTLFGPIIIIAAFRAKPPFAFPRLSREMHTDPNGIRTLPMWTRLLYNSTSPRHGSCTTRFSFFAQEARHVRWIQEGFTVEPPPPRKDSGVNLQWKYSDSGPKVRLTGRKAEFTDKKTELQPGRPPESEPNHPEKGPEWGLGASTANPPLEPPWSSVPWCLDFPWSSLTKEIPWFFECFQLFFSGFYWAREG